MPYKDAALRRKTWAASKRRQRAYPAAVSAGEPKALEAERQLEISKTALRPAEDLFARVKALPREKRAAYEAEYLALRTRCLDNRDAALAEYRKLRAEVISEAQFAALMA